MRFTLLFIFLFSIMALGAERPPASYVKITNEDEDRYVDIVDLGDGTKAMRTSGLVQIEQLFGQDPQGTWWGYIGTQDDASGVGLAGDIVTVSISAAPTPLDLVYPAVTVTTTVTASMTADPNPERALATAICDNANDNANFIAAQFKCEVIKDFSGIFISSKLYNEFGERKNGTGIEFFSTGTTVVTPAFSNIVKRGLSTELSRSPNDPRAGVLAISGSINVVSSGVENLLQQFLKTASGSMQMAINASTASQTFFFLSEDDGFEKYISSVSCFGQDNGIKFGQYLGISGAGGLTNGWLLEIETGGETVTIGPIKTTGDLKHLLTLGKAGNFDLAIQSGRDDFLAEAEFNPPIQLDPNGIDNISVVIRDDLSTLLTQSCQIVGFRRAI